MAIFTCQLDFARMFGKFSSVICDGIGFLYLPHIINIINIKINIINIQVIDSYHYNLTLIIYIEHFETKSNLAI